MTIHEHFEEFLNYLSAEKNASKLTLTSYTNDFRVLFEFLAIGNIKPGIYTLTTPILRRYISYLKVTKGYKTNTIRRKIHSLSSFFKFLMEQEYLEKNPMLPIHAPKEEQNLPIYLTKDELKLLISMPLKHSRDHKLRDKVILETLAYTGLRRQELLGLDWSHINFGNKNLTVVNGKGKKQRVIPMADQLATDLWAYLQTRLPLTNQAVFLSDYGNRMSVTALQQLFVRYVKLAGFEDKGFTIHKMRHSFATLLLMGDGVSHGADLITIQQLLGHEDLNSTKVYTHVDANHLRKEIDRFPLYL